MIKYKLNCLLLIYLVCLFKGQMYCQPFIKDIPVFDESGISVGNLYLKKDQKNDIYNSKIWVEFKNGKQIIIDYRSGGMVNGEINVVRNVVEARYKNEMISLIWIMGYEGTPMFNLFEIIDAEKNIVKYIASTVIAMPNRHYTKNYHFLDFNTIYYSLQDSIEWDIKIVRLLEGGIVEIYYPKEIIERSNLLQAKLKLMPGNELKYLYKDLSGVVKEFYGKMAKEIRPLLKINGISEN